MDVRGVPKRKEIGRKPVDVTIPGPILDVIPLTVRQPLDKKGTGYLCYLTFGASV